MRGKCAKIRFDVSVNPERAPRPSDAATELRMRTQRQRDTQCELEIRRKLHRTGVRYRIDCPPLTDCRRRADIVIRPARIAIFIDGCFWHKCPLHWKAPHRNSAWWTEKIDSNARRDQETSDLLKQRGWLVIRVWEHEPADAVVRRIIKAVCLRRPGWKNSVAASSTQQEGAE